MICTDFIVIVVVFEATRMDKIQGYGINNQIKRSVIGSDAVKYFPDCSNNLIYHSFPFI